MTKLNNLIKSYIDNTPYDVALEIANSMGYEEPTFNEVETALSYFMLFHNILYDEEVWHMPIESHYKAFDGEKCQADIYVVSEVDTFCPNCNRIHTGYYCFCIDYNFDDGQPHSAIAFLETLDTFNGFPLKKTSKTYKNVRGILEDYYPDIIAEVEENNYEE